jgi:hypothetical protein
MPPGMNSSGGYRASVIRALRQRPRRGLAVVFGLWGIFVATLWWSPLIFHTKSAITFGLFVFLPGVCAAIAAVLIGRPLLDGGAARGKRPAITGAAIGSLALVLFAPLFSLFYVLTEPSTEHWNVFRLALLVLAGAMVAVWWLVALTGAIVGWAIHRLAMSVDEAG